MALWKMNTILCLIALALSPTLAAAQAQYKVLYNFGAVPNDGGRPYGLISDSMGNLYGVTAFGGTGQYGTVFELSPQSDGAWTETVLYNFCSLSDCLDGSEPEASLTFDPNGNLYGVTTSGGTGCAVSSNSCGTAFELSPPQVAGGAWTESVLYNFCSDFDDGSCLDGDQPMSQLAIDSAGNLFGTTYGGGTGDFGNGGIAFELSPGPNGWTQTVLHDFCSEGNIYCPDGYKPIGGVTFNGGSLYGATVSGGKYGPGVVYGLTPNSSGWTFTIIIDLGGANYGSIAPVTFDSAGNLYGTTVNNAFQLNAKLRGTRSREFTDETGSRSPGGVLVDPGRNALFGTAIDGGANGAGTIWEVNPARQLIPIYSFCSQPNCTDGYQIESGLTKDPSGNIYGTAGLGGAYGRGVVFQITPQGINSGTLTSNVPFRVIP
jgi:uncharacterized repeat protein (TIGR03803 family)